MLSEHVLKREGREGGREEGRKEGREGGREGGRVESHGCLDPWPGPMDPVSMTGEERAARACPKPSHQEGQG